VIHIKGVVTGDKNVVANLGAVPARVRESVEQTMQRVVIDLQSRVVKNKLSGQLLKRRTGTLAASIQFRVAKTSDSVTGVVGSRINEARPLKYAGPLEDGFDGTVTVREHLRMMTTAWGKPVKNPRQISVRAHAAQRHIKAYHYLKSTLAENRERYLGMISRAVSRGLKNEGSGP
jgi:hypothetical protein